MVVKQFHGEGPTQGKHSLGLAGVCNGLQVEDPPWRATGYRLLSYGEAGEGGDSGIAEDVFDFFLVVADERLFQEGVGG